MQDNIDLRMGGLSNEELSFLNHQWAILRKNAEERLASKVLTRVHPAEGEPSADHPHIGTVEAVPLTDELVQQIRESDFYRMINQIGEKLERYADLIDSTDDNREGTVTVGVGGLMNGTDNTLNPMR